MAAAASERAPNNSHFLLIMARRPEIMILFVSFLIFMINKHSNSIIHDKDRFRKQPLPSPFFPSQSPVVEDQYGDLERLRDCLTKDEIIFVMYYAPWCSKCMEVRWEFHKAAVFMQEEVTFAAVNCWWPEGECKRTQAPITFPLFYVYHTTLDGFRYTGHFTADHMVNFLGHFLFPIMPLHSLKNVSDILVQYDNAVIGYFDFYASPQPPGYSQFYYAALRILEEYPIQGPKFGVISSEKVASEYHLKSGPAVSMYRLLNSSYLTFSSSSSFTSKNIVKWVQVHYTQPAVTWLSPAGSKSLSLSKQINKGPTLIMYLPHSPFHVNPLFNLFRELAIDYSNCDPTSLRGKVIINRATIIHREMLLKHMLTIQSCKTSNQKDTKQQERLVQLPVTVPFHQHCCISLPRPRGATERCNICKIYFYSNICNTSKLYLNFLNNGINCLRMCQEIRLYYSPYDYASMCCDKQSGQTSSDEPNTRKPDPQILELQYRYRQRHCRRYSLAKLRGYLPAVTLTDGTVVKLAENFTGLGCRTNKSVNFYAMDTMFYKSFPERLNVVLPDKSSPGLVLIDRKNEVQHVLEERITRENIGSFIVNFTHGALPRQLRSSKPETSDCNHGDNLICILEVTSATFQKIVMDNDKDVLLLYYAPWCGFCAGFAHIYLSLAKYFKSAKSILFARINGYENDLPWEFTVDSYPTLHFFPAKRKAESATFPSHLPKTLPNLIQFVLHYATKKLKIHTAFSICGRSCIESNLHLTATRLKDLTEEISYVSKRRRKIRHILTTESAYFTLSESQEDEVFTNRQKALHKYLLLLQRRFVRKTAELNAAKKLRQVLLETDGSFIEQHKLVKVMRKYAADLTEASDLKSFEVKPKKSVRDEL
ncbi:thioredoxin domain-containing protein 11-like [Lineus longissimus]|uniref:thioredoxin domain-containing protein 11-like n=1 Tax=Lineus longissimus TaxID=88925 RepID=UPI002B4CCD9B